MAGPPGISARPMQYARPPAGFPPGMMPPGFPGYVMCRERYDPLLIAFFDLP